MSQGHTGLRVIGLMIAVGGLFLATAQADPVPPCQPIPAGFQLKTISDESGTHRYAIFVPRNYSPDRQWPVVLFLHGAGEKGTDALLPISNGLAPLLETWPDAPFLAVFPQCEDVNGRALTGWLASGPDGRRAMEILKQVEQEFAVHPQQRHLVGWSMGGYGAWSIAAEFPRHWASVMVLAGGAVPGTIHLQSLADARTPVWALSGKQDPLVASTAGESLVTELNRLGGNGRFQLLDPAGHAICPLVFGQRQSIEWLLHPATVSNAEISFQGVKPLPLRTECYRRCALHERLIPDVIALRFGNDALAELAQGLPATIPAESLRGTIQDIHQQVGSSDDPWSVSLTGISFQSTVQEVRLRGISGGRLEVVVSFQPLAFLISETRLNSQQHSALAGPIRIEIGRQRPARLKLEVRPEMVAGTVKLISLRQSFQFDEGNWYVAPPSHIDVQSPLYTADQMTTGIVGSLYESRNLLTEQVLAVVPELLSTVERQMGFRPAPELARLLSPVPSLIPELEVGPAGISTDSQGLSLLCDIRALTRSAGPDVQLPAALKLGDLARAEGLKMGLALPVISRLTEMNVNQNLAQVNVLDISDEQFSSLADPTVMQQVLPDLNSERPGQLRTVLRLRSPLSVVASETQGSGDRLDLLLSAEQVCLDLYDLRTDESPLPIGRLLFKMQQPIQIRLLPPPGQTAGDEAGKAISIHWAEQCHVTYLGTESLQGAPVPRVDGSAFEERFRNAWQSWGAEHGAQQLPTDLFHIGDVRIRVASFRIESGRVFVELDTAPLKNET